MNQYPKCVVENGFRFGRVTIKTCYPLPISHYYMLRVMGDELRHLLETLIFFALLQLFLSNI